MQYCRDLLFTTEPNYEYLETLLEQVIERERVMEEEKQNPKLPQFPFVDILKKCELDLNEANET